LDYFSQKPVIMRDSIGDFFWGTDDEIHPEAAGDAPPDLHGLATSL
jgi:hypothetical protein